MWKIDENGNAYNEHGERIFFSVSVLKQAPGCGGHKESLGEFESKREAEAFIKNLVAKLNEEGINHVGS